MGRPMGHRGAPPSLYIDKTAPAALFTMKYRVLYVIQEAENKLLHVGRSVVRIPVRARYFCFLHNVQLGSGAQPTLLFNTYWGPFSGVKGSWSEFNHLTDKVKNERSFTSTPLYKSSWREQVQL